MFIDWRLCSAMKTVWFAVRDNNNYHKLELSRTLLHFVEYDFTYFWEQCIQAGKNARKTGRLSQEQLSVAKNAILKCHPYIDAKINTDFDDVAVDCIIEYICRSENIGLEELWARCISPKSNYEKVLFKRISEYKTKRAINQWVNIIRLQEYAKAKLAYIYDSEDGKRISSEVQRTRKEYFDLSFSVSANEMGIPTYELPYIKVFSPALMPESPFMISKVSKSIYKRISEKLKDTDPVTYKSVNSQLRDSLALEAFATVKHLARPADNEMKLAMEAIKQLPQTVYMPESFKSIIDLEFNLLCENNLSLRKCLMCHRYYEDNNDYEDAYCDRVNSSGKTCRETIEKEKLQKKSKEIKLDEEKQEKKIPEALSVDVEKRCQKTYNFLYKKVGKIMDEPEFKEWSQYLSNLKRNVKIHDATEKELLDFLDYTDKMYADGKNSLKARAEINDIAEMPEKKQTDQQQLTHKDEKVIKKAVFPTVIKGETSEQDKKLKPFVPESFDSLYDAMMSTYSNRQDETETDEERPKKHEIKKPQWEVIKRDVK